MNDQQNRRRLPLCTVTLALIVLFTLTTVVQAHSVFPLQAEPAVGAVLEQGPAQLTVRFGEELLSPQSKIEVIDASGAVVTPNPGAVDLTDPDHATLVAELPSLADGVYRVRWNVMLVDGDVSEGEYIFHIGAAQETSTVIASPRGTQSSYTAWLIGISGLLIVGLGVVWRWRR